MKGDFQVRFCEKLGLKCLCLLDRLAWAPKFFHNLNGNTKSAILVVTYVWRHTAHTWALPASAK